MSAHGGSATGSGLCVPLAGRDAVLVPPAPTGYVVSRRRYLAAAGTGLLATLAGCAVGYRGRRTPDGVPGVGRFPTELPVPESDLARGALRDGIPAITDPAFAADWSGVTVESRTPDFGVRELSPRLSPSDPVVGVVREVDGEERARAYPLRVLLWHEAANDSLGGPILVTYCPLCGSAVVAERTVNGETLSFGVSGLLWRDNLVLYDWGGGGESLWSQVAATAIRGPRTGTELALLPAALSRWDAWRAEHPGTEVLLPPPLSGTVRGPETVAQDYTYDPYAAYAGNDRVGLAGLAGTEGRGREFTDDRLPPKTEVLGVRAGGEAVAYPRPTVERAGVLNDRVADRPVVVTASDGTLSAFWRTVEGRPLRFRPADDGTMRAGRSRWSRTRGEALEGPHRGVELDRATNLSPLFWFSWLDFEPETRVYR